MQWTFCLCILVCKHRAVIIIYRVEKCTYKREKKKWYSVLPVGVEVEMVTECPSNKGGALSFFLSFFLVPNPRWRRTTTFIRSIISVRPAIILSAEHWAHDRDPPIKKMMKNRHTGENQSFFFFLPLFSEQVFNEAIHPSRSASDLSSNIPPEQGLA